MKATQMLALAASLMMVTGTSAWAKATRTSGKTGITRSTTDSVKAPKVKRTKKKDKVAEPVQEG